MGAVLKAVAFTNCRQSQHNKNDQKGIYKAEIGKKIPKYGL